MRHYISFDPNVRIAIGGSIGHHFASQGIPMGISGVLPLILKD